MIGARFHGLARFGPEPTHRERHRFAFDRRWSSQVAPGAVICRPRSKSERAAKTSVGRSLVRTTETANLDDAAAWWRVLERVHGAEAHVVGAAVRSVYHGISLARQFVVQPGIDQPPDNRRSAECPDSIT